MTWLLAAGVVLLWYLIVQYCLRKNSPTCSFSTLSQLCPSPDCARCSGNLKAYYSTHVTQKLKELYRQYDSLAVHRIEERLTFDVTALAAPRRPTVCYLRNMCADVWHNHKQQYLQDILTDSYGGIKSELATVVSKRALWSSSESSATWQKLFLYNQGKKIEKNCREMPRTTDLIEGLDTFMSSVIFGNAFISILGENSVIEPHCGPTNLRVRCHMGLQVPAGECYIKVNEKQKRWSNKECLMFDDSFIHSAVNNTAHQRIVLIVDLWHPNLTITEVKILSELFRVQNME